MLYVAAARGNFEQGLREMDARAECILYAPWPGCGCPGHAAQMQNVNSDLSSVHMQCGSNDIPSLKRAKSPILGGGMSPADRDGLLRSLASRGVLFARKLGLYQGNVTGHMAMLASGDSNPRRDAVFLFSVLAFPEYSLLEPFRKAGLLQRPEL
eukprot:s755_g23.t1